MFKYKTFGNNQKIKKFLKKPIKFTNYKSGINTNKWFFKNNKLL